MTDPTLLCVVDTNVATTANGSNDGAPEECVAASARALQAVMADGHVIVDEGGLIVGEYLRNLRASGQPGPGDAFLKWILTHEWGRRKVTRVPLTTLSDAEGDFAELSASSNGALYDPSDRKFLAVAAAHPEHPPILQSFDSKWWGWSATLAEIGVSIRFLCPEAIAAKYAEKMT